MIRRNGNLRAGFTLVELLVVVGMIAIILAAFVSSMTAAQNRARVQKATAEVHAIEQAILAYENYQNGDLSLVKNMKDQPADSGSLGFLFGDATSKLTSEKLPVLLMASLQAGGAMNDPWGHPYRVTIQKTSASVKMSTASSELQTGYNLPNFYRLQKDERPASVNGGGN